MTETPPSATASLRADRNSRRASGSSAATGSSRSRIPGCLARASPNATWARWPPDRVATGRSVGTCKRVEAIPRAVGIPPRVEVGAEPDVVVGAQAPVERHVLGEIPDVGQELLGAVGGPAEHRAPSRAGRCQSDEQPEQRRLAGTVRAEEGGDPTGRHLQRAVLEGPQMRRTACPARWSRRTGVASCDLHRRRPTQRLAEEGFHRLVVHALGRERTPPTWAGRGPDRTWVPGGGPFGRRATKVPTPCRPSTRPSCSSSR